MWSGWVRRLGLAHGQVGAWLWPAAASSARRRSISTACASAALRGGRLLGGADLLREVVGRLVAPRAERVAGARVGRSEGLACGRGRSAPVIASRGRRPGRPSGAFRCGAFWSASCDISRGGATLSTSDPKSRSGRAVRSSRLKAPHRNAPDGGADGAATGEGRGAEASRRRHARDRPAPAHAPHRRAHRPRSTRSATPSRSTSCRRSRTSCSASSCAAPTASASRTTRRRRRRSRSCTSRARRSSSWATSR